MSKPSYPEFTPPNSYIIPEGVEEGETFEDIATFRIKPGGKVCLIKIADSSLEEGDKKEEEPNDYGTEPGLTSRVTEAFKNRG